MAGSKEEINGSADQSNNNSKLWMEAMMARMLATVNQEFKSLKADLERTVKERSRRSPYQSEAENHHRNSSRSNDSRMRRHDREERQPRFSQPLGGNNLKIPVFRGTDDPEEYLDWEEKIEFVFSCREYKQEHKLMLAPTEFKDYALIWWEKLVATKKRVGDLPVESWNQMKHLMRRRFVPSHYHRKPKRAQEGREHQQRTIEQQKKVRDQGDYGYYHNDEQRSAKAKDLQKKPSCVKDSSQIVKHLPFLMKSLEAKCDLSSTLSDFVPKKLTNLEPEQPSSIVSFPQVTQEESPAETPRSLPLISELEQPIQFVTEPAHIPAILGGESQEETSAKTKRNLSEIVSEVAYEVDSDVAPELQSCEREKRPETYLSLAHPAFKPREPPDLVHRGIIVTPESTPYLMLDTKISETYNLIHYLQTFITGHSFKLNAFKFSISSIIHLSLPKGSNTGSKESLEELLVEKDPTTPNSHADGTTKTAAKSPVIFDPGILIETFPHEKDFVVSIQDGELNFRAPKTWLFHVWLKEIVSQADLELLEYSKSEQPANHNRCRMIFDPGVDLRTRMERGHFPAHTRTNDYKKCLQGESSFSSFNISNFILFHAGHLDLRSNPFQLGEDDVIMASKEIQPKEQLEPEDEEANEEAKEQLESAEIGEETVQVFSGPITQSKQETTLQHLLNTILASLVCANPTTLVVI